MKKSFRAIAFYLPQFHPIPENDKWWGKGFTEWTNVAKAKPLFKDHYQPHIPADLGFYDLRLGKTRQAQADLAKEYGIEGFCYWHYWFGNGKRLLELPFEEVVNSGKPDFPFCLGWANQSWSGIWHGAKDKILIEQKYPGTKDHKKHFYSLLKAFKDNRYIKVNGKCLFLTYDPPNLPKPKQFVSLWQELARKENLDGFHFVAHGVNDPNKYGCDSCVQNAPFTRTPPSFFIKGINFINNIFRDYFKFGRNLLPTKLPNSPTIRLYKNFVDYQNKYILSEKEYPLVVPGFDNTPRSGKNGLVLANSTPELFKEMIKNAVEKIKKVKNPQERIIFIKAWNEWAEGNYLEPDQKYGHNYLKALKDCIYD